MIHPFQPTSPVDLHPYYQDEEGTAYMRLTASLIPVSAILVEAKHLTVCLLTITLTQQLTYQDVVDLTRQEIAALSKPK